MSDLFRSESRSLLRSPWPCLFAGCIESDRGTDERLERTRFDLLPLMDVNRAPYVPVEARVEELGRVLQRSSLGEGQLHYRLVDSPVQMIPSCDHTGVPIHFHSSTTSGSASLMSLRILFKVSPR